MILIGQYISPSVRRVGIALTLYNLPFEHKPWSTFGDADLIRPYNPTLRVPVLVLDDNFSIIDSSLILEYLDGLVSPRQALTIVAGPVRREAARVVAIATAVADKAVSLVYEKRLHSKPSTVWVDRCSAQIVGGLSALDADLEARTSDHWFGPRLKHADVAAAVALRFARDSHPLLVPAGSFPALTRHSARLEVTPAFTAIQHTHMVPRMDEA